MSRLKSTKVTTFLISRSSKKSRQQGSNLGSQPPLVSVVDLNFAWGYPFADRQIELPPHRYRVMDKTLRYAKCCGKIWNLMCRLGYKPGLGLGRENKGIKKPIVLNLRESKDGLGYQGKDAPTQEPGKDDKIISHYWGQSSSSHQRIHPTNAVLFWRKKNPDLPLHLLSSERMREVTLTLQFCVVTMVRPVLVRNPKIKPSLVVTSPAFSRSSPRSPLNREASSIELLRSFG